jgi:monovalent cation/proton antiporter MnhG/PhaG subunit
MSIGVQLALCFFLLFGTIFTLGGSLGLIRFPDAYCRMHALGKPITLGMIGYLLAAIVFFLGTGRGFNAQALIAIVFILLTSPVATHMIAKSSYHRAVPMTKDNVRDDLAPAVEEMIKHPEEMQLREEVLRAKPVDEDYEE